MSSFVATYLHTHNIKFKNTTEKLIRGYNVILPVCYRFSFVAVAVRVDYRVPKML